MKIGQRSRPRMPSIDDGQSRACVNRCRSRVRSRDVSATVRPSAPLRLPLPKALLSLYAQGFDRLDPRPRLSPRFALFTRSADRRFSGPDCRPSTSATATLFFRGVGTPTSTRFSHCATKVRTLAGPLSSPSFPRPFHRPRASPCEEAHESLRAATVLPTTTPRRCKHAEELASGSHRPALTSLAGDAQAQPSLAATAVGRQR